MQSTWPPIIKPMLAQIGHLNDLQREDLLWEPKLDGTRALVYKHGKRIRILNRRQKWIEHRYPELAPLAENINPEPCLLDGEIVVFDKSGVPDFRSLQEREHQQDPVRIELLSKMQPATLVVFDILVAGERELFEVPLVERKRVLSESVKENEQMKICYYTPEGKRLWEAAKGMKLEGIMAKRGKSTYQVGRRSRDWLKLKAIKTADCVIIGYTPGEGWRGEYFGALALAAYRGGKLEFMGKVGTGFDEELLKSIMPMLRAREIAMKPVEVEPPYEVRWVKPELVGEVEYLERTHDLKLRAPSFRRLRWDKAPEECEVPGRE